ncbi:MAG: carbohydrate ABC transporter permease [Candidatus Brocadiia bacterium]
MKLSPPKRLATHLVLLAGSVLFLFPFVWLVSTSLKPIEQTMMMPPQWVPRAYYAPLDGERTQVTRDRRIEGPSVIVTYQEPPQPGETEPEQKRELLPADRYRDGMAEVEVRIADQTKTLRLPAALEKPVPPGFWLVTEKLERLPWEKGPPPRWDCVPAEAVEEQVEPAWQNYVGAIKYLRFHTVDLLGLRFEVPMFVLYFYNTMVVAVLGVAGMTFSSALAAYGFSRIRWPGRELGFVLTLSTMMVPFAVIMVPLYGVFRALGWIGTLRPLWVPAFFGNAFNIFLLRQFFLTVPQDLSDAARIDGCSELGIFLRIMLPLSKPALAVVALFHFMYAWKDFMGPLIFLTDERTFTLSLGLYSYQSQHGGSEWHYLMAASTLMILPVIVLFFFTQRTFIQGISTTGMKG